MCLCPRPQVFTQICANRPRRLSTPTRHSNGSFTKSTSQQMSISALNRRTIGLQRNLATSAVSLPHPLPNACPNIMFPEAPVPHLAVVITTLLASWLRGRVSLGHPKPWIAARTLLMKILKSTRLLACSSGNWTPSTPARIHSTSSPFLKPLSRRMGLFAFTNLLQLGGNQRTASSWSISFRE